MIEINNQKIECLQDKYTLYKSNLAIRISNNLSVVERKFFNQAIYIAQQDLETTIYQAPASLFNHFLGNSKHRQNHTKIKNVFERLLSKIIDIVVPTDKKFIKTTYLASAKLENGIIYFELSQILKQYLCINVIDANGNKEIQPYTKLNMRILQSRKSTHTISLYEFLKSRTFATKEVIVSVDELRRIISAPSKFYESFARFNENVLKHSIQEISEETDLKIQKFETIKGYDNKTVEAVRFIVEKQVISPTSDLKQKYIHKPIQQVKNVINAIIEPVKDIFKPQEQKLQLAIAKEAENLPEPIAQAKEWGYKNINQLMQAYNSSLDKKRQILAILSEVGFKYSDKPNDEKCRLIASLIKINACYKSTVEIEQEDKKIVQEMQEKQQAQAYKQQQEQEQQQKAQLSKQNHDSKVQKYKIMYSCLTKEEKLKIFTLASREWDLKLSNYTEDEKFTDFNNFSPRYQTAIIDCLKKNEVTNNILNSQQPLPSKKMFSSVENVINNMLGDFVVG